MRRCIFALAVLGHLGLLCAGAWAQTELVIPYTYDDGTSGSVRCQYTDSTLLEGAVRVDIGRGPASVEVNGAEFFYVRHGYGGWPAECAAAWGWPGMERQALTTLLLGMVEFHLRINGVSIAPNYLRVDPADGKVAWYFEFPAGSLPPGVYSFEGSWERHPVDVGACLAGFEPAEPEVQNSVLVRSSQTKTCTVTVVNW